MLGQKRASNNSGWRALSQVGNNPLDSLWLDFAILHSRAGLSTPIEAPFIPLSHATMHPNSNTPLPPCTTIDSPQGPQASADKPQTTQAAGGYSDQIPVTISVCSRRGNAEATAATTTVSDPHRVLVMCRLRCFSVAAIFSCHSPARQEWNSLAKKF